MKTFDFKPLRCTNCQQSFTGKNSRGQNTTRFPYILDCKHSVCAACIGKAINNSFNFPKSRIITCYKCNANTEIPKIKGEVKYDELFISDIHALGLSCLLSGPLTFGNDVKQQFLPAGCALGPTISQKPSANSIVICEYCSKAAFYFCNICKKNSCGRCFDLNHKVNDTLKNHKPKPLRLLSYRTELQQTCYRHPIKPIEFYCEYDEELICGDCAKNCQDESHNYITITEKNALCMDDLRKELNKAKYVCTKLKEGEATLEEVIPKNKYDASKLELTVREYFHRLHSTLLIREHDLIQELRNASNEPTKELKELREDVNEKRLKLSCLINDAKNLVKNRFHSINGVGLLNELKLAVADKTLLVSEESPGNDEIQVLNLDSNVEEMLSKIGEVHSNIKPKYKLIENVDIPEELCNGDSHPKKLKQEKIINPIKSALFTHKLKETDLVEVMHIVNPHHFYVQRVSNKKEFTKFNKNIQNWCQTPDSLKAMPTSLYPGVKCLAKYSVDGHFYRASIEYEVFEPKQPNSVELLGNQDRDKNACYSDVVAKSDSDEHSGDVVLRNDLKNKDINMVNNDHSDSLEGAKTDHCDQTESSHVVETERNDDVQIEKKDSQMKHSDVQIQQNKAQNERSGEVQTERSGEVQTERSGEVQTERSGEVQTERSGEVQTERNGEVQTERNGEVQTQRSGEVPTERSDDIQTECSDVQIEQNDAQTEHSDDIQNKPSDNVLSGCSDEVKTEPSDDVQSKSKDLVQTERNNDIQTENSNKISENAINWYDSDNSLNSEDNSNDVKTTERVETIVNDKKSNQNNATKLDISVRIKTHRKHGAQIACKKSSEPERKFKVTYYDFGNSEVVPLSRLRTLPKAFSNLPPQAVRCSLWDIVPPSDGWPSEAAEHFHSFIDKKIVTMKVMDKVGEIYEVDLIHAVSEKLQYDSPVSVREALVFCEMAYFPSNQPDPTLEVLKLSRPQQLRYFEPEPLSLKAMLPIRVTAIESPDRFFIQLATSNLQLQKLQKDLEAFYNQKNKDIDLNVYAPLLDHPYVALLEDNTYHRVIVKELPGKGYVIAKDVDYGNVFNLHCKNLRKITESFIMLPNQAYCCCMADVKPFNDTWTQEAIEFFKTSVKLTNLQMVIHKMLAMTGYVVSLYLNNSARPEIFENLNGLLVKKGFAIASGPYALEVEIPKHKINGASDAVVIKPKKKKKKSPKPKVNETTSSVESSLSLVENVCTIPDYIEVKIVCYQDAGCFYVQEVKLLDDLASFMDDLYEEYENSKADPTITYEIDDKCAVYDDNVDRWYRGIVQSKDDDRYTILCEDFGYSLVKTSSAMRVLATKFKDIRNYGVRCHLEGIKPAGDSKKWSGVSMTHFTQRVQKDKIMYIEQKEKEDCVDSLPVNLFDKVNIRGGALEPDREEMFSVTEWLLECGVAIPTRNFDKTLKMDQVKASPIMAEVKYEIPKVKLTRPRSDANWLPALLPTWKNHQVCPTYVGYDGFIYLQTKGAMVETAIEISAALQRAYEENPFLPTMILEEGQICAARFYLDMKWYRSRVIKIWPEEVEVLFVDFGNAERIKIDDIRVQVAFLDTPIQNLKCELYNVKPISENGQWPLDALNFMHSSIVEKQCVASIEVPVTEGCKPKISLTLPGGISLAEYMIKNKYAEKIKDAEEDFIMFKPINFYDPFPNLWIPEIGTKFPVTVSYVLSYNIICVQKIKTDKPVTYDEMKTNREFDVFRDMIQKLQKEALEYPVIENPQKDEIYCVEYDEDESWCRGLVTDVKDGIASVFFLDYGNSQDTPLIKNRIRELPEEFYNYPKYGMICKLHGVEIVDPSMNKYVTSRMMALLLSGPEEGHYLCEIIDKSTPYMEIELYSTSNNELSFAYKKCLDSELLVKV